MNRFECISCDWAGDQSQASCLRMLSLGAAAYVTRDGRSLPSCPRCLCPAVPAPEPVS